MHQHDLCPNLLDHRSEGVAVFMQLKDCLGGPFFGSAPRHSTLVSSSVE